MIDSKALNEIKEITQEFFNKMSFEPEIEASLSPSKETVLINVKMDEPQILIGERGQTLSEIQYLLKLMLRRRIIYSGHSKEDNNTVPEQRDWFFIDIDINDYKKKKSEYLKELACSAADEVALSKKERTLAPMSAYERRIIHLEIAERENVTSESIGQESERRIIIRPYP